MTDNERNLVNAVKTVASTDAGAVLLEHLSDYCFERRSTFVEGNHDKQNINNGKRAVILHIRDLLKVDLDKKEPEPVKDKNYI